VPTTNVSLVVVPFPDAGAVADPDALPDPEPPLAAGAPPDAGALAVPLGAPELLCPFWLLLEQLTSPANRARPAARTRLLLTIISHPLITVVMD
jgi:hypothetical protein